MSRILVLEILWYFALMPNLQSIHKGHRQAVAFLNV